MAARCKAERTKSFCLSILQWNAGGLSCAKFSEVKKVVVEEGVDVVVIQEANITEDKMKSFNMKDFTTHGLFKSRQIASGILVAVRNKLTSSFEVVKTMNNYDTAEIVAVNVWNGKTLFKIYGIYSPPNNKNLNLDLLTPSKNTIIVGDFNAASPSWGYTYQNQTGRTVEDFMDSNAMFCLFDKDDPNTFIHYSGSSTNPDLVMVSANLVDNCKKSVIGDPGSGHRMIKTTITTNLKPMRGTIKIMWNFKKANWKAFTEEMENQVGNFPCDASPHLAVSTFTSAVQMCAKKYIPRGRINHYQPFWNTDLEEQRNLRERVRREAEKETGKTMEERRQDVIKWRKESAIMKRKVLEAKRKSWNKFLNEMDYRTDGKKAYQLMSNLNNKRTQRINHPIKIGNKEVSDPILIAKKFNDFYLERYSLSKEQKKWEKKDRKYQSNKPPPKECLDKLFTEDFSSEELNKALKDLKKGKQPGPDNIFPEFLIHLGQSARKYLLIIYNKFWNENLSLPTDWVKAKVIPILKPGKSREDIKSYRPISLTSIMVKTFERMLTSRLKFYLESNEVLVEEQAGFRNNMSTTNSILKLVHKIKTGFNLKRSSLAVFIDFQGAYDTIWRSKLLSKIYAYGIRGNMYNWFKKFLSQRWVKTRWNEVESQYKQSKVGLPQGAVSSCTLFNIYINDLVTKLNNIEGINVSMFADDVVIWTEAANTRNYQDQRQSLENTMNKALEALQTWSIDNNMIVNKTKTVYQFFSLRQVNADFALKIDNVLLQKSISTTYLGVVLDNKLNFNEHVKTIKEKVEKRTSIMKRLAGAKWGSKQTTLNKTYNTYVKPIIKYGSEVLISITQGRIDSLERAQNKALRIITGAVKTTPIVAMQSYTSNPPIAIEIKKQAVGTFIKMKASQRAQWINVCNPSSLKTQISPIEVCNEILQELDANKPIDSNKILVSPLEYIDIENQLEIKDLGKKDISDTTLRANSLCVLCEQYPEPEWTRVYTDGSKIQDSTGAGVYSKLFSQCASVGCYMSNFDAEIFAISLALKNLKAKINCFSKAVILVDSKAAIQAVTINHCTETQIIIELKQTLNFLRNHNKTIVFQWIPSHVGIDGNEKADSLAKRGVLEQQDNKPIPPESLKRHVYGKIMDTLKSDQAVKSIGKSWANIQDNWNMFCDKPRKEAVANFRLKTGHDCLAEHLNRIGILQTNVCQICKVGVMNAEHLLTCPGLDQEFQRRGEIGKLYWSARTFMNSL